MRVFLADTESYVGKALFNAFSQAEHEMVAVDQKDPESTRESVALTAELVILDLLRNPDMSANIIKALKESKTEDEIVVVGLSSIMAWGRTHVRDPTQLLAETDFKARKCSPKYKVLKMTETLLLSAQKGTVQSFVIAPGIVYGHGEEEFHKLFQDSWMCETDALTVAGKGSNVIPTIHLMDLVQVVMKVAEAPPVEQQYIVAVDNSKLTQTQIVQAVAKGLGSGRVKNLSLEDEQVLLSKNSEVLLANMQFDSEKLLLATLEIPWVCETGLEANFEQVRTEYVASRKLKPMRIMMHGPPAAGKTEWGARLAKKYYLPHVKLGDVIKAVLEAGDEFSEQVAKCLEDAEAGVGGKKKKNKPKPPKPGKKGKRGKGGIPEDDRARIPDAIIVKMMKRKLRSAACRNKGFVLDGFPRTVTESKMLFTPDLAEGEEPQEEAEEPLDLEEEGEPKPQVATDPTSLVEFVVSLEVDEDTATQRTKDLPEAAIIPEHNDEEGFQRRWQRFEAINDPEAGIMNSPLHFLQSNKLVDVLEVPSEISANEEAGVSAMSMYVEKGGPGYNYHPTPEEVQEAKEQAEAEARRTTKKKEEELKVKEAQEKEERLAREAQDKVRKAQVLLDDQQLVEACSLPLRKYLVSNVIPSLVDGLLEVCKVQPEDPIDYLAEFLFKQSVGAPAE